MKHIKSILKRLLQAYIRNTNEFYKPIVDAGVPIIM